MAAEALAKKKKTRAGHKASATKIIRHVEEVLATEAPDRERLSLLRLTLNEKLEIIKALDTEVIDLIDDEEALANEIEQADGYKEGVFQALIRIDRVIIKAPPASISPTTPAEGEDRTLPPVSRSSRVRLPKLQLRSFSGDLTKWTSFWESFESAVHINDDLSNVEKFNYLNSLLERSAREAVSGLALTAANYQKAIDTLHKRFGCKQLIINKHMDALLQFEAISSSQNIRVLRKLFDDISCHIRSLKSLGVEPESYGGLLCPVLLSKIPQDLRLIVSRKVSESDWKLDLLMTAIEEELEARERIGASQGRPFIRKSEHKTPPTATTLVSGGSTSTQTPHTCCYCDKSHSPNDCDVITQVEARKQSLRRNGRCYSCLRKGHRSRDCRSSSRCHTCRGRHHTSICGASQQSDERPQSEPVADSSSPNITPKPVVSTTTHSTLNPSAPAYDPALDSTALCAGSGAVILLQTALADVNNPENPSLVQKVRIVMDCGSQRSYLTKRVKDNLSLPVIDSQNLSIAAFGSSKREPRRCDVVRIGVHTKTGSLQEIDLLVVPHICDPLVTRNISHCSRMYAHLMHLDLADVPQDDLMQVDMLIGSDLYWRFVTGETVRGQDGPVAVGTTLGWVLSGPAELPGPTVSLTITHSLHVGGITNKELDANLRSFWELESLGIQSPASDPVIDQFTGSVKMKNGRYEVSLPWRAYHDPLPNNYELSRRRLLGLLQRLKREPMILREYDTIIRDQLQRGIVEVVDDSVDTAGNTHYLPHHAVIRQDKKTTKVRVVYDASAHSTGPSLNDCLHTGPKFNQRILEILLRFRSYQVGVVADLEKAFLMIAVEQRDRDVLRFLWVEDAFAEEPHIIKLRFTRVVFGVSSSPFLLNATLQHHIKQYCTSHPELADILTQSIYVDDVIFGADTEEEAYALYMSSKEIFAQGSFNLRKFVTNVQSLQRSVDAQATIPMRTEHLEIPTVEAFEESYAQSTLPINPQGTSHSEQKVLGVHWDVVSDQLVFTLEGLAESAVRLEPTKRNVVSLIGQFYDPLGYLSPITIRFKVLMQQLCKVRLGWDHPLEGELLARWKTLVSDLQRSEPVMLPRCYFDNIKANMVDYRLYGFCDASTTAYAAVVYLVKEDTTQKSSSFVASKTRVAPLKPFTIPRLELLSAALLARLITTIAESLSTRIELREPRCFTDSQVTYYWIRGVEKDWKPFVQNRVNEIHKLLPANCWVHVSGKENPADIPSRGMTPLELSLNLMWKNGPAWMQRKTSIESEPTPEEVPSLCLAEMKATSPSMTHNLLITQSTNLGELIDIERFRSSRKLFRTTAYVLKFLKLLRKETTLPELTPSDVSEAERCWVIEAQSSAARDHNFVKWKTQFGLFQDDHGLWRCGGRLQNADLTFSTKHPVILPKNHRISMLIARDAHQRVLHDGVKETLTEIRARYWIIGGRSLVRSVLHKCVVCKRFEGKPFVAPPAPPLPSFRVNEAPPFLYTAVDFAGPMFLKDKGGLSGSKVWIALFTCCVTRAVHLELVPDMTTTTFVRCLKRFSARRGLPKKIISDNAKTFKATAKLINAIFSQREVKDYLSHVGVEWSFNLEKAPWWGGIFERMVKSTKRCLRKIIGRANFCYDEMYTAVVEIEAIINSRPLTFLGAEDAEEPLTPSHLIVGRRLLSLPDNLEYSEPDDEDFKTTGGSLQRRAKHLNSALNHFWKRWSKEYLLELRDAHRHHNVDPTPAPVKPGDVVVVHDEGHPRAFWKLARVKKLIVGRDGLPRVAVLRLPRKDGQQTTLQRPLQLIHPLEIPSKRLPAVNESQDDDSPHDVI